MAIPITIPRLGWNMDQGTFVAWLKYDGDPIRPGDALFSLDAEKAIEEVECLDAGILRILPSGPKPGDKLPVGAVIAYLVEAGESTPESAVAAVREAPRPADRGDHTRQAAEQRDDTRLPAISPRALRVAQELGVDWTQVQGSGRTGRIRDRDVRAASSEQGAPLDSVRRAIAERMRASLRAVVPVTLTTLVDATALVQFRARYRAAVAPTDDPPPGVTDIVIKLAAIALQQHPQLNATWSGDRLVQSPHIHIGIAVDTERGLLVPVIRDVPSLRLEQIAEQLRSLAARARAGQLKTREMDGGTFTITNLGAFGIDAFTPIIHYPQVAILGIGRIQSQPAVVENEIKMRDRVTLSLTFDHCAVDGAPAARFLQTLSRLIEEAGRALEP